MITDEQNARSKRLSPYQPVNRYTGTLNDPFMQAQSNYMGPEWGQYFGALQKIEEDAKDAGHNYRVDWSGFGNTTSEQESGMPRRRGTLADLSGRLSDADAGRQFDADVMDARVGQLGLAAMQRQEQAQKDAIAQADIDRQRQDYEQFKVASAFQPPMGDTTIQRTARPGQSELITGRPNIAATPADPRAVLESQIQRLPANHPLRLQMEKSIAAQDAATAATTLAQTKTETELAKAGKKPALTPVAESNLINKLSTQWVTANKTSQEMERQFNIMKSGIERFDKDPNGASQAVLVTFQKMLDPESVVRESEYARSSSGVSLMHRIEGYMERLASGGAGVPKRDLEEMVKTAEQFKKNTADAPASARKRLAAVADRYEIPHDLIFSGPGSGEPAAPSAPVASTGTGKRIRVVGPNNQTGSIEEGDELPAGWRKVGA